MLSRLRTRAEAEIEAKTKAGKGTGRSLNGSGSGNGMNLGVSTMSVFEDDLDVERAGRIRVGLEEKIWTLTMELSE